MKTLVRLLLFPLLLLAPVFSLLRRLLRLVVALLLRNSDADTDSDTDFDDRAADLAWNSTSASTSASAAAKRERLETLKNAATCFAQFEEASRALDRLDGAHLWQEDPVHPSYDYKLLQERLKQLKWLAKDANPDPQALSYLLRSTLSRNLGDMGSPCLYSHARIGTKQLVHEYIDQVCSQLDFLADSDFGDAFTIHDKMSFFRNVQRSFGSTALLLSGGATFGMIHVGVLKALHEANALPKVISGSSAGSIVAAILCTQESDNFEAAIDPHMTNREFYEDSSEVGNIFPKLYRFMNHGCVFDVEAFIKAARANLGGDITFQEAYNKSRRILNIAVSSSTRFEMPRLLNYLTAPNVVVWSAVAASCALPLIYRSAPLMYKNSKGVLESWNPSGHRWIDGSVEGDLPMTRISELFDVNHFIVCQVNPHIMPFLSNSLKESWLVRAANNLAYLIKSETLHRLNQLYEIGIVSRQLHRLKSILVQKYSGDITIVPNMVPSDYLHIITNPSNELTEYLTLKGERATWPKIPLIQNHVRIEMCIDQALLRLRARHIQKIPASSLSTAIKSEEALSTADEASEDSGDCGAGGARRKGSGPFFGKKHGSVDALSGLGISVAQEERRRRSLLRTESLL